MMSWHQPDALADRLLGGAYRDRLPIDQNPAGIEGIGTEYGSGSLGATGADEASNPEDFASSDVQGHIAQFDGMR